MYNIKLLVSSPFFTCTVRCYIINQSVVRHGNEYSNNLTNLQMVDNTDEENLDTSTNIQPENPSDQIIPANNTETINTNQETENMEVHKHPHHVTQKKKWKGYLLEF